MEQYRIETHLHTNHTSKCGWLDAAALAEGYALAGYAAVAVTDHYNRDTFEYLDLDTTAPDDVMSLWKRWRRSFWTASAGWRRSAPSGA